MTVEALPTEAEPTEASSIPADGALSGQQEGVTGKRTPTVSIIIPCYNYAHFLRDAVESALAQTVQPLEILLIDDGSTDNTAELAAAFPRPVRYVPQVNAGLSAARNRGIAEAKGEFIAFLDADDAFHPQMLERCLETFAELGPEYGLVAVQPQAIHADGSPIKRRPVPHTFHGEVTARQLIIKNRFVPTVMVRRSVFESAGGFDTTLRSSEDREMWIRVAKVTRVWLLEDVLSLKRSHGSNMSGNAARQSACIEEVLRKTRAAGGIRGAGPLFWAKAWSFYYYQSALMFRGAGNWPKAFGNLLRSLILWPVHTDLRELAQRPLFRLRWLARFSLDWLNRERSVPAAEGSADALRVMHVVLSLEPGGMENGVVNMAHALDGRGLDIRVACISKPGEFHERLPDPAKLVALGKGSGFSLKHVFALGAVFARERTRVAHTHNLGPLIYTVLAIAARPTLWGRVAILHGEHAELNETERSGKRLLQRQLFYRLCTLVHTVSHSLKDDLVRMGLPEKRIAVAVNGVDTQRFEPLGGGVVERAELMARLGLSIPPDALVLGMVGRFGKYKRHDYLLAAFEKLAMRLPSLHLVLVGDKGPERERVHALVAASAVKERIHLAGFQQDVRPFYQGFDLLVVPSINEGLSNAVLEAMATGLPILASSACGNREVMEDGVDGFVRDLSTPALLESELSALVGQQALLRKVGATARDKVIREFSLQSMAARYGSLYRQTAGLPAETPA